MKLPKLWVPPMYTAWSMAFKGLLQGKIVDLDDRLDDKMEIELLKRTPSSYLGSCRFKLPNPATDERPFVQLFELFAKLLHWGRVLHWRQ